MLWQTQQHGTGRGHTPSSKSGSRSRTFVSERNRSIHFLGQPWKSSLCLIQRVQKVTSPEKQGHVFIGMKGTHLLQLQKDTPLQKQNPKSNNKPASFLQWPLDRHLMPPPEVWQAGCGALGRRREQCHWSRATGKQQQQPPPRSPRALRKALRDHFRSGQS